MFSEHKHELPLADPNVTIISKEPVSANRWREFLCVQKLDPQAYIPTKATDESAGYDLYSFEETHVPAWGMQLISTQIKISLPVGVYGRVASRSGLSIGKNLEVGAGVIDRDYRGEIKVVLRNFSDNSCVIKRGDRVAQLILEQCLTDVPIKLVSNIEELFGKSERGDKGFGSSGQ